jgi:hypothetical protein
LVQSAAAEAGRRRKKTAPLNRSLITKNGKGTAKIKKQKRKEKLKMNGRRKSRRSGLSRIKSETGYCAAVNNVGVVVASLDEYFSYFVFVIFHTVLIDRQEINMELDVEYLL